MGPPLSLVLDAAATLLCGAVTWQEWSSETFPLLPRSLLISKQQSLHGKALLFVSENNCQESSQQWLWLPEGVSARSADISHRKVPWLPYLPKVQA